MTPLYMKLCSSTTSDDDCVEAVTSLYGLRGGGGILDGASSSTAGGSPTSILSSIMIVASTITKIVTKFVTYVGSSTVRCWMMLFVSILLEILATTCTKLASDTKNGKLVVLSMSLYMLSLLGFTTCLSKIEVGTAYATWAALGTGFVSTIGILFFKERCDVAKIVCISMIVGGVVGLSLTDGGH